MSDTSRPTEFGDLPPDIQQRIFQPEIDRLLGQISDYSHQYHQIQLDINDNLQDMIETLNIVMAGTGSIVPNENLTSDTTLIEGYKLRLVELEATNEELRREKENSERRGLIVQRRLGRLFYTLSQTGGMVLDHQQAASSTDY